KGRVNNDRVDRSRRQLSEPSPRTMRYHRPVSHRSLLVSALGLILGSACAGADDGGSQASVTPTGSTGQSETDGSSGTQGPSTSTATTGGMAATGSTASSGDTANTSSAVSSSG